MGFVDNLSKNSTPIGGSGIFGMPPPQTNEDSLSLVNRLKDREMKDFVDKANYMSDLSFRQEQRMRNLYNPTANPSNDPSRNIQNPNASDPNSQMMHSAPIQDPNQISAYQKGELGVRNRETDLESQRISQQGKLGQEAADTKSAQEKLNKEKSDQINELKTKDLERKIEESNQKIEQAKTAMENKQNDFNATLEAHKAMAAAVEERHKLEMAAKDHQFQITSDQHQKQIDALEERVKQGGNTQTTTELNADGTKKTVTTKKGDAASARPAPMRNSNGTYHVHGPNGFEGDIPAEKLDDWMTNHQNIPDGPGGDDNVTP